METRLKGMFPLCRLVYSQLHHSENAEGSVLEESWVSTCIRISYSLGGGGEM